jgi:hypothetical protein
MHSAFVIGSRSVPNNLRKSRTLARMEESVTKTVLRVPVVPDVCTT